MKQRIVTGLVLLAIFIPIIILSYPYPFVFVVAASLMSTIAVHEMLTCTGQVKKLVLTIPAMLYAAAGPLLAISPVATSYGVLLSITLVFLFYLLFIHVFAVGKINTRDISVVFTTSVYITVSFTCIVLLRNAQVLGDYVYMFIFIGAWVTDIFAYFGGRFFGRHKLCPKVSPKKTVEGAISGILFCALFFVLYSMIIARLENIVPNYVVIALIGAFISVISQFGDLAASAIKRDYDVKDYGKIFPGHGGVLDRFDSILAVAPFLYMLMENPDFITVFQML